MTTFGLTINGFVLRRLADILSGLQTAQSGVQDPATGEFLTPGLLDENDPLVQFNNAVADIVALAWEQLQLVNNQWDPLASTGAGLSGLVQLNGLVRKAGTPSLVTLSLTGVAGSSMIPGQQASNAAGTIVFILPAVTFDGNGDATVVATCSVNGPIEAEVGTITRMLTPQYNWISVSNAIAATPGTDDESDSDLRARQQNSTSATASSLVESVYGALLNLTGVTFCRVYQNLTLSADARSIPAKSIAVVVLGGADADIAQVLWQKASAFPQYGSSSALVTDAQGISYTMKWSRPTPVPIYVAIAVTVVSALDWPANGADLIKAAILSYAATGAGAEGNITGVAFDGWTVGQNVYASELYVPISSVGGIKITSVAIGTSANPTDDHVDVDWNEISEFISDNIEVTVS